MPIKPFPTRTDGSFGRDKSDVAAATDLSTQLPSAEYDNVCNWLIAVIAELGATDGSDPGSVWEAIDNLQGGIPTDTAWGDVTGTLSDQTDLQQELNTKTASTPQLLFAILAGASVTDGLGIMEMTGGSGFNDVTGIKIPFVTGMAFNIAAWVATWRAGDRFIVRPDERTSNRGFGAVYLIDSVTPEVDHLALAVTVDPLSSNGGIPTSGFLEVWFLGNTEPLSIGGQLDTTGSPDDVSVLGIKSQTTGVTGGTTSVIGGDATVGNANGGDLILSGGAKSGTGTLGKIIAVGSEIQLLSLPLTTNSTIQGANQSDFLAIVNANSPNGTNHFATMNDVSNIATVSGAANLTYTGPVGYWSGSATAFPDGDVTTGWGNGSVPGVGVTYIGAVTPVGGNVTKIAVTYRVGSASIDGSLVVYKFAITDALGTITPTAMATIDLGAAKVDSSTEWYKNTFTVNFAINAGDKIGIFKRHTSTSGIVNASFAALVTG